MLLTRLSEPLMVVEALSANERLKANGTPRQVTLEGGW